MTKGYGLATKAAAQELLDLGKSVSFSVAVQKGRWSAAADMFRRASRR